MEARPAFRAPSMLDLRAVAEAQRAVTWKRVAGSFFPGLSVSDLPSPPALGWIQGNPFGPGHLWRILSPPLHVSYTPPCRQPGPPSQTFSVMLQLEGSTLATQNQRRCKLRPREICLIDGQAPFELEVTDEFSQFMFLQIPRHMVLGRYAWLERRTAAPFDSGEPGTVLLSNVLLSLLESVPYLENDQCTTTLVAISQLLGVPKPPPSPDQHDVSHRARAALALIDAELSDPTLTASRIAQAQGISRRRLDEILLRTVGTSLAAQIWIRRLTQAASDLLDPRHASKTVTQIAFNVGFEDAAHFTRAFKRRYHCTPSEWRARGAANVSPEPQAAVLD